MKKRDDPEAQPATDGSGRGNAPRSQSDGRIDMMNVLNPPQGSRSEDGDSTLEFRSKAKVGLFAGVTSGFIIDARSDLQPDSQQNLLSGIWDALRQPPVATEDVQIPASAKWIYILWLLSLQLTLFCAVMGVLAKDWLERLAPTPSNGEALAACKRYRLDNLVQSWHLEFVITLVPLFVQIASFLFLVGLVVRCFADDRVVGFLQLAFFIAGGIVYLLASSLPFVSPSSPIRTPLSGFISSSWKVLSQPILRSVSFLSRARKYQGDTSDNEVLGTILKDLLKSSKPEHVDEAAAEIAFPSFNHKWIERLCADEIPRRLMARFQRHVAAETQNSDEKNAILRHHLLAFVQFVEFFEVDIAPEKKYSSNLDYWNLLLTLQNSIASTHPIHRWNTLGDVLKPLAFSLKVQLLIVLDPSSGPPRLQTDDIPPASDIDTLEMSDRPWELAFREIRSQDRLYLMLSVCRGALTSQKNLKATSSSILCLRMAKAGCVIMETNCASGWASQLTEGDCTTAKSLADAFVSRFWGILVEAWGGSLSKGSSNAATTGIKSSDLASSVRGYILGLLISGLSHPSREIRTQVIAMLVDGRASARLFSYQPLDDAAIDSIAEMVIYDVENHGREYALKLLEEMTTQDQSKAPTIRNALLKSCIFGCSDKALPEQQMRAINFVRTLSGGAEFFLLLAFTLD
ncbi:hypothetical protein MD484_g3462, partial [Candolleomyces efflorescens]